jgi:hypothetical protein
VRSRTRPVVAAAAAEEKAHVLVGHHNHHYCYYCYSYRPWPLPLIESINWLSPAPAKKSHMQPIKEGGREKGACVMDENWAWRPRQHHVQYGVLLYTWINQCINTCTVITCIDNVPPYILMLLLTPTQTTVVAVGNQLNHGSLLDTRTRPHILPSLQNHNLSSFQILWQDFPLGHLQSLHPSLQTQPFTLQRTPTHSLDSRQSRRTPHNLQAPNLRVKRPTLRRHLCCRLCCAQPGEP